MTDESKKKNGDKRIWRFVFTAMVLLAALQLLGFVACWLIGSVLGGISFSVPAAAVGIIGGADGPTAIFVTGMAKPDWPLILWIVLLVIGITGLRKLRGNGKE